MPELLTLQQFYAALKAAGRYPPAPDQQPAVEAGAGDPLYIVAGPGTGKTSCLTLRILKLILVDGVPPAGILATTFTKKAAAELRSRILGWGFGVVEQVGRTRSIAASTHERVGRIDINQVLTGTIDSICERILRDYREPATQPPVLVDEYVSRTLMLREGLLPEERRTSTELDQYLFQRTGRNSRYGWNIGTKADLLQTIWDRRAHDQVDWEAFLAAGLAADRAARDHLRDAIASYEAALTERGLVDFTTLEQQVLIRLQQGRLDDFRDELRAVLVDEYQDTNLLQERLYFELAKGRLCRGALTVVGDDDQSLYRFRGATVELFTGFPNRYRRDFRRRPSPIFLRSNYRSTTTVIQFVNDYALLDPGFQQVRVRQKPPLQAPKGATEGLPILGMFRDSLGELAMDLATLVHAVFCGRGYRLPDGTRLQGAADGGAVGDCALLASSPQEYGSGDKPRLPHLLRQELANRTPAIQLFNPRGEELCDIGSVASFGGLLLECLDPGSAVQGLLRGMPNDALATFNRWRALARQHLDDGAPPALRQFVEHWGGRDPGRAGYEWPRSVGAIDLVYALVHYFPELHDDAEGQVYLEVFTKQLTASAQIGKFEGRVVTRPDAEPDERGITLSQRSVMELLRDWLGPIANGSVKVTEELIATFPRDRLSVLSIHQAKGLEFPLVIVDVGSDFKTKHHSQAFKRFPSSGGDPHVLEDAMRPFSELGAPPRLACHRAFDDLYRQYFVAFSRPKDVLLLVGLTSSLPGRGIPNVATGYRRDETCGWAPNLPFTLI